MKKLLIINKTQFGYHVDSFKYCQYLKSKFDVTYICFDTNYEKIYEDGIQVIYLPYPKSFVKKGFDFINQCRMQLKKEQYDIVFIVYFIMSSLVRLGFKKDQFILDIRTGAVDTNSIKRTIKNKLIRIETFFFSNVSIISECLSEKLKIKKTYILPLGSDPISSSKKSFQDINLLYVGSLYGRDIYKTVLGLARFIDYLNKSKAEYSISYDIIGFGGLKEEELLQKTIIEHGLEDIVIFHGKKLHTELMPFFEKANVGISFVPITDYYDCQPPTKTFEYINSGLFCIGTSTKEHQKLISHENGILCNDSEKSFCDVLIKYNKLRMSCDSSKIATTLKNYHWKSIIENNLYEYLKNIGG